MKLTGKIVISGKIVVLTGLRIGAGNNDFDLGSPQLSVVKSRGVPFIPGSSLKGKLRSLLAKYHGSDDISKDKDDVKRVFGSTGTNSFKTRLLVRDCVLSKGFIKEKEFSKSDINSSRKSVFTESKWENVIKRTTGAAENPREVERVPEGSEFEFELIYDTYDKDNKDNTVEQKLHLALIKLAMKLLEDDYLGGYGSRGYGKVKFIDVVSKHMEIEGNEYKERTGESKIEFVWEEQ